MIIFTVGFYRVFSPALATFETSREVCLALWCRSVTSVNVFWAQQMAKKPPQTESIESIGAVLEQSLKRFDLAPRLDEYGVWPIWREVVGKMIARNAQPEKIRNGTLFVKVSSPVWMQELQFMKEMIAGKLNQRLNGEIVKNIFFMVGRIDEEPDPANSPESCEAAENLDHPVNQEFLQSIADPEIRAAFKKLLKSYARRQPKI
jgi:hypothetical protein